MHRTKSWRLFAWALLVAFSALFLLSKSSPAYPVNDWSDANIYLTIGRGMTRGQVVYRDLYDHKGPLLYALHALCALLSFDSFLGVYVMEGLLLAVFLFCAGGLMQSFGLKRSVAALLPILAVLICSSFSFAEGDSAEEMCLPMIMATLWGVCAFLQSGKDRLSTRSLVLHGWLVGNVFWVKFTLVGAQAGLLGFVLLRHAFRREWKSLFHSVLYLLAGFGLSTLPWILYFGIHGAIGDWLRVYLYDNLFLYSAGESAGLLSRVKAMFVCGMDWLIQNLRYTLLIALGLVWFALREKQTRTAVWLMAALGALAVFAGGKSYAYYGLALAGMTALGLIPLGRLMERAPRWLPAASLALCLAACPLISHNMNADYGAPIFSPKEETMQHRIAAQIPEGATLLNYGFMDAGFYTAAGVVPQVKYFHQTNVPLQEMLTEQRRYVEEGLCDYVVTRAPLDNARYELVTQTESPAFWYETVYLYRRIV